MNPETRPAMSIGTNRIVWTPISRRMRLETQQGGSQISVVQDVVPGCIGAHSDTHPHNGLINVFEDGVKTRVQDFLPHRMILSQRYEPCCRMHSATTSLKAAILDHGEEFQPITVRFSIPHADTVRVRLLDDCAQHMFQQSVRVRFLSKCVECVSERVQLATCQKFRRAQRFGRLASAQWQQTLRCVICLMIC